MKDDGPALAEEWAKIPSDADVVVVHGPARGIGDLCNHGGRAGSVELARELQTRVKPSVVVHGHIHEDWGAFTDGQSLFINAAFLDMRGQPSKGPIVFDLPPRARAQAG